MSAPGWIILGGAIIYSLGATIAIGFSVDALHKRVARLERGRRS